MKATLSMLLAISATLAGRTTATEFVTTTNTTHKNDIEASIPLCNPTGDGLSFWYYNSRADGPYSCTKKNNAASWSMLPAYRSGGTQGVHWKYTENLNDGECLRNWKYYAADGLEVLGTIERTTTANDPRRWCALPVYRPGGVENKQWNKCNCRLNR